MRILRNLTLHVQGEREIALAADHNFRLVPEPLGVEIGPGEAGLREGMLVLVERLRQCRNRDEAVLVGGHTGLWLAAVIHLLTRGEALPELYYFDTRRVRDADGHFHFTPEGLVRVQP